MSKQGPSFYLTILSLKLIGSLNEHISDNTKPNECNSVFIFESRAVALKLYQSPLFFLFFSQLKMS